MRNLHSFRRAAAFFVIAVFALINWQCEQKKANPLEAQPEDAYTIMYKQTVFQRYDEAPEPIGGFAAIRQNLQYPDIARRAGIQGRVILNLLIRKTGNTARASIHKKCKSSSKTSRFAFSRWILLY